MSACFLYFGFVGCFLRSLLYLEMSFLIFYVGKVTSCSSFNLAISFKDFISFFFFFFSISSCPDTVAKVFICSGILFIYLVSYFC